MMQALFFTSTCITIHFDKAAERGQGGKLPGARILYHKGTRVGWEQQGGRGKGASCSLFCTGVQGWLSPTLACGIYAHLHSKSILPIIIELQHDVFRYFFKNKEAKCNEKGCFLFERETLMSADFHTTGKQLLTE